MASRVCMGLPTVAPLDRVSKGGSAVRCPRSDNEGYRTDYFVSTRTRGTACNSLYALEFLTGTSIAMVNHAASSNDMEDDASGMAQ